MDTLKSVAHLQRELGSDLFSILISSDNTAVVKKFAQGLVEDEKIFPIEIAVHGRLYEISECSRPNETFVIGHCSEMNQDDGEHILKYQSEIPVKLRNKVTFIFPSWRSDNPGDFYYIYYRNDTWALHSGWRDFVRCYGQVRFVRRKYPLVVSSTQ